MLKKIEPKDIAPTLTKEATAESIYLFDCDGTLIRGDINNACFKALLPLGLIDDQILPKEWQLKSPNVLRDEDFKRLHELLVAEHGLRESFVWEIKSFQGLPKETVRETAAAILAKQTDDESIETHTEAWKFAEIVKDHSYIVSGSERSCIEAVADQIGISRENVVASTLQIVDGMLMKTLEEPGVNWEENKPKSLKLKGIESAYFCAGDSTGDIALLDLATHWRWCVIEAGDNIPPYKKEFKTHLSEKLEVPLSSEPGLYIYEPPSGPKTLLQVVNHHY